MTMRGRWVVVGLVVATLSVLACSDSGVGGGDEIAGAGGEDAQRGEGGEGGEGLRGSSDTSGAPGMAGARPGNAGDNPGGSAGSGTNAVPGGAGGEPNETGGAGAGGAPLSFPFACIERGTACDTLDDCLVGELCVEGACVPGKPQGDPCTGEEVCGRDVRCVAELCTYKYSISGLCGPDPQSEYDEGPDPWLWCPVGTYCGYWGPFSSLTGPTCTSYDYRTADRFCGTEGRCAFDHYCQSSGSSLPEEHNDFRCQKRIAPGPEGSCFNDHPDECEAGYVCNWVNGPEEIDNYEPGDPPLQLFGCVPPGQEGDYCNPGYPYLWYHESYLFPSQCGPNLYCSDEASPNTEDFVWDPHGRCVPLPEPTVAECETTEDCSGDEVCHEFFLGFMTCGTLPKEGDTCWPGDRLPCADGLECLLADEFFAPHWGYCTRVVELGEGCDEDDVCADDATCVAQ